MPALVVRDLVTWLADRGGRVVAGTSPPGLDRGVEGVSRPRRINARDLDAFDIHDVIITPIDAFHAGADITLADFIAAIADAQSALIVAGLPDRDSASDWRPYEAADQLALPLLAIPAATDLVELTREIVELIRTRQTRTARRVREVRAALSHARQADDHLQALASSLANATGLTFVLEDEHRVVLLRVAPDPDATDPAAITEALASYAARQAVRPATPGAMGEDIPLQRHLPHGLARAIVPLRAGGATIAYLSLLGPEERVVASDVDVLWQVAPSFAFEMGKLRKQTTDVRHSASDDLAALFAGTLPEAEIIRRALAHSIDLATPHAVAVALPIGTLLDPLLWAAERQMAISSAGWAMAHEGSVRIVLPAQECSDEALLRLVQRLAGDHARLLVTLGMGRPGTGIAALRQSLREAQQAAQVGVLLPQTRVTRYANLGIMRLLYPPQEIGALDEFWHEMLDPILLIDTHQGEHDSLVGTLATWFAVNCNMMEAARRLDLHRNTLAYRLNRIEEALNASLDDMELRLSLQVALKLRQMRKID